MSSEDPIFFGVSVEYEKDGSLNAWKSSLAAGCFSLMGMCEFQSLCDPVVCFDFFLCCESAWEGGIHPEAFPLLGHPAAYECL